MLFASELGAADHRRFSDERNTKLAYDRWKRDYLAWCVANQRQATAADVSDEQAVEWVQFLVAEGYAPKSIEQAICALKKAAQRADANPMPTFDAARAAWREYIRVLAAEKEIVSVKCFRLRQREVA